MGSSYEDWQVTSNDGRTGEVCGVHRHYGPQPGFRIAVHRVQGRDGWFMTCHPMGIFGQHLAAEKMEDACQEAANIAEPWLDSVLHELRGLL